MRPDEEVLLPPLRLERTCREMWTSQRSGYQLVLITKCLKYNKCLIVYLGMGNTRHTHWTGYGTHKRGLTEKDWGSCTTLN